MVFETAAEDAGEPRRMWRTRGTCCRRHRWTTPFGRHRMLAVRQQRLKMLGRHWVGAGRGTATEDAGEDRACDMSQATADPVLAIASLSHGPLPRPAAVTAAAASSLPAAPEPPPPPASLPWSRITFCGGPDAVPPPDVDVVLIIGLEKALLPLQSLPCTRRLLRGGGFRVPV